MKKNILILLTATLLFSGCTPTVNETPVSTENTEQLTQPQTELQTKEQTAPADTTAEVTQEIIMPDYSDISTVIPFLKVAQTADTVFITVQSNGTSCRFYAYKKADGAFTEAFTCRGYIGRTGICSPEDKFEGDGHTPAGAYSIGEVFGIKDAPCTVPKGYTKLNNDDYWDSDPDSDTYNQHVKGSEKSAAWLALGEYEHLSKYKGSYDYAAMINYNVPATPKKGSAIFLHCTSTGSTASAGCVAIPAKYMISALEMITENTYIVIVRQAVDLQNYIEE